MHITIEKKYIINKYAKIALAQQSFWDYCKITESEFYRDDRPHLIELCDTLQNFYESKLINADGEPYKKLMINIPPQHGKTRTLVNFGKWILGQNTKERILNGSYNDSAASDFGRFLRDGIDEQKNTLDQIVYSDIFPNTKLKYGNKSFMKWALDGQHFNFLATGAGGSVTGKGGTVKIIDDMIKNAEEASNELKLDKDWLWYVGTWGSRNAADDGEPLEIICFTRWSKKDICGRLLETPQMKDWYILKMEVYDKEKDIMLCPSLFSKKAYSNLKELAMRNPVTQMVFMANYHQETIDIQGRLYKSFKTYTELPKDKQGNSLLSGPYNYTDTADEGDDYLCSINYGVYDNEAYILDVYYTKEGMEVTEPGTALFFNKDKVAIADIESNNGGRGFSRAVQRILKEKYGNTRTIIRWFHQSKNKKARIMTGSAFIQEHVYFPINWIDRWPEFFQSMSDYQKEGKNGHDDAEDATTGVTEKMGMKAIGFLT